MILFKVIFCVGLFCPSVFSLTRTPVLYESIDRHAMNTPASAEKSIETLSEYLVRLAKTEEEKVRAIFFWVTHHIEYDAKGYFSGTESDLTPDKVLKKRIAVCDGYAGLFESLGQAAGLEIEKISGYAKGYSYSIGDRFKGPPNHAWNAVKIRGEWRLLDPTWGAGHLNESGRFISQFDDHFFLTPPEQMIYTHFPENMSWQLLKRPLSLREFEEQVYLKPAFFHYGLNLKSHTKGFIQTDSLIQTQLIAPDETLVMAQLIQGNQDMKNVYTMTQRISGTTEIWAVFPQSGTYTLRIFAKDQNDPGLYTWALDYQIKAETKSRKTVGFPEVFQSFYKHRVYLYCPMTGYLKSGQSCFMKIKIPGAVQAAVVEGDNWQHLEKKDGLFEGNIFVRKGTIEVYALFPGSSEYNGLLRYTGI